MSTVVAVSRNGAGRCWLFASKQEARLCPLVQLMDPVLDGARSVDAHLTRGMAERLLPEGHARWSVQRATDDWAEVAWRQLAEVAERPPKEPADLLRIIVEDRRATEGVAIRVVPEEEHSMAKKAKKTEGEETADEAPKEKASGRGIPKDHVITAKTNKDGVSYFQANPKKQGKKNYDRFAQLRDGMTVDEALKAGVTVGDLHYDVEHGFIEISAP